MIRKYSTAVSLLLVGIAVAALVSGSLALSIEREPVKVTHRNSGPKYEIDEVERTKLTSSSSSSSPTNNDNYHRQPPSASGNNNNDEPTASLNGERQPPVDEPIVPVGHVSIRRIFLVPMTPDSAPDHSEEQHQGAPFMPRPFWPFALAPARPPTGGHRHLFGTDEASRSPTNNNNNQDDDDNSARERPRLVPAAGEREEEHESAPGGLAARPIFDPIQMMVDMMQQALNGQLMPPVPPAGTSDLNKDASSSSPDNVNSKPASEDDRSIKPQSQNETKEDIVEIEGKKYLRKTVINRHVGENIIFMTKRLIFVPLNETDPATTTTTTTTTTEATSPTTTLRPSEEAAPSPAASPVDKESAEMPVRPTSRPKEEASSSTTAATTSTSETLEARTEEPATSEATPVQPSASESTVTTTTTTNDSSSPMAEKPEEMTTTTTAKSSWVDRVSDAIDKAAERIVERTSSRLADASTSSPPSTERPPTTVSP